MEPTYTTNATLMTAAVEGNVERVKGLLKEDNQDVLGKDRLGRTALHYALLLPISYNEKLKKNKTTIANHLIDMDKKLLGMQDSAGDTPVHFMASAGFEDLLSNKIVKQHQNLLFTPNNFGMYPIHTAIAQQQHSVTKMLLSVPGMLQLTDSKDRTLFHHAASMNNQSTLHFLFDRKTETLPDINQLDGEGKTALDIANAFGFEELGKILKKHGGQCTSSFNSIEVG